MLKLNILVFFVTSILMLTTCVAQDASSFKDLETQFGEVRQSIAKAESMELLLEAFEQLFPVRMKIEEALKGNTWEKDYFKGSSLEGASAEQINTRRERFTKTTWDNRVAFAGFLRQSNECSKAIEQLEIVLRESKDAYGPDYYLAFQMAASLRMTTWQQKASESDVAQLRKTRAAQKEAVQLLRKQSYKNAVEKLKTVLLELESLGLDDSIVYGQSLNNIAEGYLGLNQFENAQDMFERAIKLNDEIFKKKDRINPNVRCSYAGCFLKQKQHGRAIELLEEADQLYQAIVPVPSFDRAVALCMKGESMQALKDYENATRVNFEAIDILTAINEKRLFGPLEESVNECYEAMNKVKEPPAAMAASALSIGKRIFGDTGYLKTTDWLLTIAKIKHGQQKLDDSKAIYKKAEVLYRSVPEYQTKKGYEECVVRLRNAHASDEEWRQAAKYAEKAVQCALLNYGKDHVTYGRALASAGMLNSRNENHDAAEKLLAEAIKIVLPIRYPGAVGKKEYVNVLLVRAINLQNAKRWGEAIPIFKNLDELTVQDSSIDKITRTAIVKGLTESYRATNQSDLADQYSEQIAD